MPSTQATADSLAAKLQSFHATLDADEQTALEDLLKTLHGNLAQLTSQPMTASTPAEIQQLNTALQNARGQMGSGPTIAATWTLTTTVTVMASHPKIGC